jgi:hypothetical protein
MELDEFRAKWAEHDRKLETSIRLNRRLLREIYTRRARFALRRLAVLQGLGSVFLLAVAVSLGAFIAKNFRMPRSVLPAVLLDVLAIATLAAQIVQIALALQIDYDQPVAAIQKRIEMLKRVRLRYIQGICLAGALIWIPFFAGIAKAFRFDNNWIIWNVLIGLALIPLGIWLVRKLGAWMNSTAQGRKIVDSMAGYNLSAAAGFMEKLERFEREGGED